MIASDALYPLLLEPLEREVIWGGHALAERYGKRVAAGSTIGESWECWDGNRVLNGSAAGATLADLRALLGGELTGTYDPTRPFPLLTKLIDARDALSVQVHPGDEYARRVEGQPNGKTECWVVLEADPGAQIVLGWNRATSRGEYLERVKDGSLGDVLRRVPARAGDVFNLPAGTLHAIGAGVVLFEVQQASELTYRIFDYDRRGPDGKARQLHVEKAADVLDFGASKAGPIAPLAYELHGLEREVLVAENHFILERVRLDGAARGLDLDGSPLAVMALEGPVDLEARGHSVRLAPYQTAVVPAALETLMVSAANGRASVFTAAPPADRETIERRFSRAAVPISQSTAFLAQF
jgi:mannose-6-phosphate isomerase